MTLSLLWGGEKSSPLLKSGLVGLPSLGYRIDLRPVLEFCLGREDTHANPSCSAGCAKLRLPSALSATSAGRFAAGCG